MISIPQVDGSLRSVSDASVRAIGEVAARAAPPARLPDYLPTYAIYLLTYLPAYLHA